MPLGAFKTALLGAAGSGSANNFIGWWDWSAGASGTYRFLGISDIAVNSEGDMVVNAGFRHNTGSSYLPLTVYINDDTTVKWNKMLSTTSDNRDSRPTWSSVGGQGGVTFDSSGDVWVVTNGKLFDSGWNSDSGTGYSLGVICFQKYSKTDGTLSIKRILNRDYGNYQVNNGAVSTIGSNAFWINGESDSMYHSWGIDLSDVTSNYMLASAHSPNGGSLYATRGGGYGDNWCGASTAYRTIGSTHAYRPMVTTNANGAFGFAYQLFYNASSGSTNYYGMDCDMDTSGNKYVAIRHQSLTPGVIMKVSGHTSQTMSIDWQKAYEGTCTSKWWFPYAIKADSSGNTYTVGYVEADVDSFCGKHGFIMKHNSSGVLQWTRMFTPVHSGTGKAAYVYGVDVTDDDENIVVTGQLQDNNNYEQLMVAKLPADGSGTGSYVTGTNAGTIKYYDGSSYISSVTHNLSANNASMSTGGSTDQENNSTSVTSGAPDSDLGTYRTQDL
jgi:hypothetical protein